MSKANTTVALERKEAHAPAPTGGAKLEGSFAVKKQIIKDKFPGGMNKYERSWMYQFFMLTVLTILHIVNLNMTFEMIKVFEDLIADVEVLQDVKDVDPVDLANLLASFNETHPEATCDLNYFENLFIKQDLVEALTTILRVVKASAYLTVGFGIWVTFLIRAMSAYTLCTDDFGVTSAEKLMETRRQSLLAEDDAGDTLRDSAKAENQDQGIDLANIIRTNGAEKNRVFETVGEKKIRIYLRSETVLFGFNQVIQDIPMTTACVLYLLFLLKERGIKCYEALFEENEAITNSLDEANPVVLGQLAVIFINIFVNLAINLAPRWVAFFHYQTVKHALKPKSTSIRVFQVMLWTFIYLFAIFAPLFLILYSQTAEDLLGVATSGNPIILVLLVMALGSLLVGSFIICCFWGVKFGEQLCLCCIVVEAAEIGCESCFSIEICELIPCC